jgi:ketosteroid isomerase-like protein
MSSPLTGDALSAFLAQAEAAADAYVRGDMDEYLRLVPHDQAFTLFPPYGGPASRHEHRDDDIRTSTGFIQGGTAHLEHVETHMWGDTLIVAMIERQHGRVDGRPDQGLSLRVTHVYRFEEDTWRLVHRHADPLVDKMTLPELMGLMSR